MTSRFAATRMGRETLNLFTNASGDYATVIGIQHLVRMFNPSR